MASNHHCFMKPSSWDQQRLTSPLEYAVGPKTANTKTPTLKMRWGAECKSPQPPPPPEEGAGRSFFLDILFHRMSDSAITPTTRAVLEPQSIRKINVRSLSTPHSLTICPPGRDYAAIAIFCSDLKPARSSSVKSFGCSQAAK